MGDQEEEGEEVRKKDFLFSVCGGRIVGLVWVVDFFDLSFCTAQGAVVSYPSFGACSLSLDTWGTGQPDDEKNINSIERDKRDDLHKKC